MITFDIINAMRYYEVNDKDLREQRNRKTVQTGIVKKDPKDYTADCTSEA